MGIRGEALEKGIVIGPADSNGVFAVAKPKKVTIEATVTRANGRVEKYGAIAFYHRNPVINALGNAWIRIKERFR